ncbi:hypothetical protein I4U23_004357 [Adineta vaga]|nr:hypothetical protein I4U23_004357 [Adineta vaga]
MSKSQTKSSLESGSGADSKCHIEYWLSNECHYHICVGGTSVRDDISRLEKGVQIVLGTHGRVHDMLNQSALRTKNIKTVILNEADSLLSHDFETQINGIFTKISESIQVILLMSFTSSDILKVATKHTTNPVKICMKEKELTFNVHQFYVADEHNKDKSHTLCDLIDNITMSNSIIFCNSRRTVIWLAEKMGERDFKVSFINITKHLTVLLACLTYVGGFFRKDVVISFVTDNDRRTLRDIEEHYNI